MSNFWNKDGLVVGKIISDDIVSSSGEKFLKESEIKSNGGHALGEQWISFDGTIPDGGLPFDGQLRNVELYQQLYDWANENGRVISETEWQHLRETNNGNVPYYSSGDGTGTFRLPIFNSYFKADVVGGEYIAEGLPNITGTVGAISGAASVGANTGAFAHGGTTSVDITNGGENDYIANFDASRCSAVYGNSEHVTPETSTVIVGVWAVSSYTNVTNIDMSDIKEAIDVASTIDALPLLSYHWDYKREGNAGWVKADGYWLSGNLYKDAYEMLLEMSSNSISSSGIDYGMKFKQATYTTSLDKSNPYDFLIDTTAVAFRLPFLSRADKLIVHQTSSQIINGGSTPRTVTETWYSDGTVEIDGTYDASAATAGTINWITSLKVPYNLILQDTRHDGTETDTEGWGNLAGPSGYTATSFRVSHFKGTGRIIDFHIKGEPTIIDVPKYRMMYFKLGNTFINEEQMDAANLSNKIDRVWESWQEADYVVESYSNGTEWYRLYKSGWLEQGGEVYHNVKEIHTVNLLVPYRDTYYNVTKTIGVDGIYTDSSYTQNVTIYNYTTTSFDTRSSNAAGLNRFRWRACGYSDNLN